MIFDIKKKFILINMILAMAFICGCNMKEQLPYISSQAADKAPADEDKEGRDDKDTTVDKTRPAMEEISEPDYVKSDDEQDDKAGDDAQKGAVTARAADPSDAAELEENGEKTVITMAWWGSAERHNRTERVIQLYEKLNPDIEIEFEYYSFDNYFRELDKRAEEGRVWDIFQMGSNYGEYIDHIYPLDEFVNSKDVDLSDFSRADINSTVDPQGRLIGLTNGINAYGIAYDPALFNEAGAELPSATWTWDEYEEAADLIHERLGIYGCSTFGSDELNAGGSMYVAQAGRMGQYSFYNSDLTGLGYDDPDILTPYIDMRAGMIRRGSYPDVLSSEPVTDVESDFLVTGEAAMAFVAANQFPTMYELCRRQGRQLDLTVIPRVRKGGPSGLQIQSSQMFCMSDTCREKKEAARFISWFENDAECNKILRGERGIPANSRIRAELRTQATVGQRIMYNYIDLISVFSTGNAEGSPVPAGHDTLQDNYREYIDMAADGQITAEEAARMIYDDALALFR